MASKTSPSGDGALWLIREDLRLHDNQPLLAACTQTSHEEELRKLASLDGVVVQTYQGLELYDQRLLIKLCDHEVPIAFNSFLRLWTTLTIVAGGTPDRQTVPVPGMTALLEAVLEDSSVVNLKVPSEGIDGSTTLLSPYIAWGCLSPRFMHWKIREVLQKLPPSVTPTGPPQSLLSQLLWRDFFHLVGSSTPYFERMQDNPLCLQVPWRSSAEMLHKWATGATGVPVVDAAMRQLRCTGWLHHILRHVVACFLTRGALWCHWEDGRAVFEALLLDADWAINN
eukprot:gene7405-8817_t